MRATGFTAFCCGRAVSCDFNGLCSSSCSIYMLEAAPDHQLSQDSFGTL